MAAAPPDDSPSAQGTAQQQRSRLGTSWLAIRDVFAPFSSSALASLPRNPEGIRDRATRADRIPETVDEDGARPSVRDYHSITGIPPTVRVPKKLATPIRVEPKVWFANERTWISYLNVGILLGTLALALFNAAGDAVTRYFAYAYAAISVGVLVYGYAVYQHRVTMIRRRDPGHFDQVLGPLAICVFLFVAVLANFLIRLRETCVAYLRSRCPIDPSMKHGEKWSRLIDQWVQLAVRTPRAFNCERWRK